MFNIFIFFSFVLGLVFGSFLNCLVWRLNSGRSIIEAHSVCPKCSHKLTAKDLVPIFSFILQKGRCRYCQKNISWWYPLGEILTALIFTLVYLKWGLTLNFLFNIIISWFLIFIFIYDLRYYQIPDEVSVPGIVLALIFSLILGFNFFNLILAVIIGGGFFLLQFLVSRGRWLGAGDIRLGVLMGLVLGFPVILAALVLAYIGGSIIGVLLIISKKKKFKSEVPFGVFLVPATIICLFYGPAIVKWYLSLIWY